MIAASTHVSGMERDLKKEKRKRKKKERKKMAGLTNIRWWERARRVFGNAAEGPA